MQGRKLRREARAGRERRGSIRPQQKSERGRAQAGVGCEFGEHPAIFGTLAGRAGLHTLPGPLGGGVAAAGAGLAGGATGHRGGRRGQEQEILQERRAQGERKNPNSHRTNEPSGMEEESPHPKFVTMDQRVPISPGAGARFSCKSTRDQG